MVFVAYEGKASQLKFVRVAQMLLFSNVLCDPPLGQETVIPADQDAVGHYITIYIESLSEPCSSGPIHRVAGVKQVFPRAELGSCVVA